MSGRGKPKRRRAGLSFVLSIINEANGTVIDVTDGGNQREHEVTNSACREFGSALWFTDLARCFEDKKDRMKQRLLRKKASSGRVSRCLLEGAAGSER